MVNGIVLFKIYSPRLKRYAISPTHSLSISADPTLIDIHLFIKIRLFLSISSPIPPSQLPLVHITHCQFHPYHIRQRGSKHPIEKKTLYWFGIINFPLPTVSFIHIILGRGGPSTPLKNPLLVWNHHLPPKSNSLYKNFWNSKIARIPTTNICYVALELSLVLQKKKSRSNKPRL